MAFILELLKNLFRKWIGWKYLPISVITKTKTPMYIYISAIRTLHTFSFIPTIKDCEIDNIPVDYFDGDFSRDNIIKTVGKFFQIAIDRANQAVESEPEYSKDRDGRHVIHGKYQTSDRTWVPYNIIRIVWVHIIYSAMNIAKKATISLGQTIRHTIYPKTAIIDFINNPSNMHDILWIKFLKIQEKARSRELSDEAKTLIQELNIIHRVSEILNYYELDRYGWFTFDIGDVTTGIIIRFTDPPATLWKISKRELNYQFSGRLEKLESIVSRSSSSDIRSMYELSDLMDDEEEIINRYNEMHSQLPLPLQ